MADQPKFHKYQDLSQGNQPTLTYDQLLKRAQAKKADTEKTKAWVEEQASIENYVSIKPTEELALIDYYSSMPDVEVEPEVKAFFEGQIQGFKQIDLQGPQNEYLRLYGRWQDIVDQMDQKRKDELGIDNLDTAESDARQGIKDAQERLHEAKKRRRGLMDEVNPVSLLLGPITGQNKDAKKIKDARDGVTQAKKGVADARKRLVQVQERKARLQQQKDKLSVDEHMLLDQMNDALGKMAKNQETAAVLDDQQKQIVATLHKQYQIIDNYNTLKTLKSSADYPAIRLTLKTQNPALFQALEELPDTLPNNAFKITLRGPIQLPDNSSKLTELNSKIGEVSNKLPDGVTIENLSDKISELTLKETDTPTSLEEEMKNLEPTSEEYKKLEAKKKHLELQQKVNDCNEKVNELKREMTNTTDDKEHQKILKKLSNQQQILKVLKEQLDNDTYSKTLAELNQQLESAKELQKLNNEKNSLDAQSNFNNLNNICENLETSNVTTSKGPLNALYSIYQSRTQQLKDSMTQQLSSKYHKIPGVEVAFHDSPNSGTAR